MQDCKFSTKGNLLLVYIIKPDDQKNQNSSETNHHLHILAWKYYLGIKVFSFSSLCKIWTNSQVWCTFSTLEFILLMYNPSIGMLTQHTLAQNPQHYWQYHVHINLNLNVHIVKKSHWNWFCWYIIQPGSLYMFFIKTSKISHNIVQCICHQNLINISWWFWPTSVEIGQVVSLRRKDLKKFTTDRWTPSDFKISHDSLGQPR